MKRNRADSDIVIILTCTLVTVVAWIAFEVARVAISNQQEVEKTIELQIKELKPQLRIDVLDVLEKRNP